MLTMVSTIGVVALIQGSPDPGRLSLTAESCKFNTERLWWETLNEWAFQILATEPVPQEHCSHYYTISKLICSNLNLLPLNCVSQDQPQISHVDPSRLYYPDR